jgi:hypothetical protein
MQRLLLAVLLCACHSKPDDMGGIDAPQMSDAPSTKDAPFTCMPVAPRPAAACLALDAAALTGDTPFGLLSVDVDYFGAGDCITISQATIGATGACGEKLAIQFSYPVSTDGARRRVTQSFDVDARVLFQPPGVAMQTDVANVHVEVVRWEEGQGVHDIDITVTISDARYALPPLRIAGTFCDWPYYLC